jgi:hypothetical protein
VSSSLTGDSLLVQVELAYWDSDTASRNPEEYEAYLEQFPYEGFVGLARARVKALRGGS